MFNKPVFISVTTICHRYVLQRYSGMSDVSTMLQQRPSQERQVLFCVQETTVPVKNEKKVTRVRSWHIKQKVKAPKEVCRVYFSVCL